MGQAGHDERRRKVKVVDRVVVEEGVRRIDLTRSRQAAPGLLVPGGGSRAQGRAGDVQRQQPGTPRSFRVASLAWVALALIGSMVVGSLADLVDPDRVALLPLVVAPFGAAVLLPLRATLLTAGLSVALCLVLPQAFLTSDGYQYLRFASLAALDVLAVVSTLWRERLVAVRVRLAREQERTVLARRHALEVNDHIYQSLFAARTWADIGHPAESGEALDRALVATADLLGDLLDDIPIHPGSLRHAAPSRRAGQGGS